jgi:PRTRC genetic system protein E
MFTELKSLLERRSLTITVAAVHEHQIRVNVIPHPRAEDNKVNEQITYSHKDEVARIPETAVKALTTPISLTGTAEEIDSKFASVLLDYVESHVQLQGSFDRASTEIAEAVKAIDERNKTKGKARAASSKNDAKSETQKKSDGESAKPEDTLPLWWTDKAALPPGAPAPGAELIDANVDGSRESRESAEIQEVSGNAGESHNP